MEAHRNNAEMGERAFGGLGACPQRFSGMAAGMEGALGQGTAEAEVFSGTAFRQGAEEC
jgi:hypothetical protein